VTTLRSILLRSSLSLIAVLVSFTLLLVAVYTAALSQEHRFGDVILLEQGLLSRGTEVVRTYNEYRNSPAAEQLQLYTNARENVRADFASIEGLMLPGSDRNAFEGLRNTMQAITDTTDAGVRAVQISDVSATTAAYEEGNVILSYLPATVSQLVTEELEVTRGVREQTTRRQELVLSGSLALLLLVIGITIITSIKLARRVSGPIEELARLSHAIAGGTYDVTVEPWLVEGRDEIAVLAGAFDTMSEHLRVTIAGLQKANQELLSARDTLSSQNAMLERLNNLFISREQRIRELKGELRAAGRAVLEDEGDEIDSPLKGV